MRGAAPLQTMLVYIVDVNPETKIATVRDQLGKTMSMRIDVRRVGTRIPAPPERWIIDRSLGDWTFAAVIDDDFADPLDDYLPLAGGTMSGHIDMDGHSILDALTLSGDFLGVDEAQIGGITIGPVNIDMDGGDILNVGDLPGYATDAELSGHNHDLLYSALSHNHTGVYAPLSHVHSGSDITSGTVDFARLPTGTGSSEVAVGNHAHTQLTTGSNGVFVTDSAGGYMTRDGAGTGAFRLDLDGNGTVSAVVYGFFNAADTGWYYAPNGGNPGAALAANGAAKLWIAHESRFPGINDTTTASAANVFVNSSSGLLARSTSSLRYKSGWQFADLDALADLELPIPITWLDNQGGKMLGFGTEHIYEMLPEATQDFDDEGRPENYDVRAIVAVLAAKMHRLEGRPVCRHIEENDE